MIEKNQKNQQKQPLIGKEEMNLCEFPIVTTGYNKKLNSISFTDTIYDEQTKKYISRHFIVEAPGSIGLPRVKHLDIYYGLLYFGKEQGCFYENSTKDFTEYKTIDMLDLVKWTKSGRDYIEHDRALLKLSSMFITAHYAIWDNEKKRLIPTLSGMHIIDDFRIYGYHSKDDEDMKPYIWESNKNFVRFGALFLNLVRKGYIKDIDLTLYFSLRNDTAKLLYRYLDKEMYRAKVKTDGTKYKDFDIKNLAEHIGLSVGGYRIAGLKRQLEKGLNELLKYGWLSNYEFDDDKLYIYQGSRNVLEVEQEIIKYFKHLVGREEETPTEKEKEFAKHLYNKYKDIDMIKYMIGYAVYEARETNFRMIYLQAIQQYLNDAEKSYHKKQEEIAERRKKEKELEREKISALEERKKMERLLEKFKNLDESKQKEIRSLAKERAKQVNKIYAETEIGINIEICKIMEELEQQKIQNETKK
jgi:hypothetical protein